jgi:MscS family membrane protein
MSKLNETLDLIFFGNTLRQFCWTLGIILLSIIFKRIISRILNRILFRLFKKYSADISMEIFMEYLHKPMGFFFVLIIFYVGFSQLQYPAEWHLVPDSEFGLKLVIEKLYLVFFIWSIIWICVRIVDVFGVIMMRRAEKTPTKSDNQIIPFMIEVLKIVVISIGVFLVLGTVFNLNVGSLIAGLGIGGLAVALAAKETLENLMGSFTIFLDKPFVVGDLVNVGEVTGVVEKIGFRSTRIRTLEQSLVTVPNKKMVDAELDNITLRTLHRVKFNLSLRYDTSSDQLKSIIADISILLDSHSLCNKDSIVRLSEFGQSAIEVLVLYFVNTGDWEKYLEIKEEINFKILDIVRRNKASFAYTTTTVHIEK